MTIEEIKRTFRTPDADDYPELAGYTRSQIYEGKMGPGGLYLAALMTRGLELSPGKRVMDLGCGSGTTSIFLAKRFGVSVVAVDLWIDATRLDRRFHASGVDGTVFPLNLDVTEKLPFADDYFDAIFCMDSIHYYGAEPDVLPRLFRTLKPGGRLGIGSPCFTSEFNQEQLRNLPSLYDDGTDLWPAEFSRYHSPGWWSALIDGIEGVRVLKCEEPKDAEVLWEDDILDSLERKHSLETLENDADQIRFRRERIPHLTHFVLTAEKEGMKST